MSGLVLILRPQPGADETATRALELGLTPVLAPLFSVRPLPWHPPAPNGFDAVMLTSANAARHGGDGLASFAALPCYATGEATAAAAREAGFLDLRSGASDGAALLELMAADGVSSAFHPCGRDRIALAHEAVQLTDVPVYAAEAVRRLPPEAEAALTNRALVLIHSPRAGRSFAELYSGERGEVALAAISPAAAAAAGEGWRFVMAAHEPRDEALLELASKLCQTDLG
jgi:uroporphyrinogen-III synthase